MPDKHIQRYWTLEYPQAGKDNSIEAMQFRTDLEALDMVDNLKKIGDPAWTPVALIEHVVTTTTELTRKPLGVDHAQVLEAVRRRLLAESAERGDIPKGADALAWAVEATIEELGA